MLNVFGYARALPAFGELSFDPLAAGRTGPGLRVGKPMAARRTAVLVGAHCAPAVGDASVSSAAAQFVAALRTELRRGPPALFDQDHGPRSLGRIRDPDGRRSFRRQRQLAADDA